jgi:hypothetical protein
MNEKESYEVGYTYYYDESGLRSSSYIVCGEEVKVKEWVKKKLKTEPEWLQKQVENFDSKSKTRLFATKINIVFL